MGRYIIHLILITIKIPHTVRINSNLKNALVRYEKCPYHSHASHVTLLGIIFPLSDSQCSKVHRRPPHNCSSVSLQTPSRTYLILLTIIHLKGIERVHNQPDNGRRTNLSVRRVPAWPVVCISWSNAAKPNTKENASFSVLHMWVIFVCNLLVFEFFKKIC